MTINKINYKGKTVISNEIPDIKKIMNAEKIIGSLSDELKSEIKNGSGPFLAAIYDSSENLIAKKSNSVLSDGCSNCHAEINAIKEAEKITKKYCLSGDYSIYITAEPCIMCLGAIMWSGIKNVYYGAPSETVEKITGFDEGFKPDWQEEFKKRGITVYGNIGADKCEDVLNFYVKENGKIYKPERQ